MPVPPAPTVLQPLYQVLTQQQTCRQGLAPGSEGFNEGGGNHQGSKKHYEDTKHDKSVADGDPGWAEWSRGEGTVELKAT